MERLCYGNWACICIPLVPKTYAVLQYLVRHAGRLITKEEHLDVMWSDEHGSDAALKGRKKDRASSRASYPPDAAWLAGLPVWNTVTPGWSSDLHTPEQG